MSTSIIKRFTHVAPDYEKVLIVLVCHTGGDCQKEFMCININFKGSKAVHGYLPELNWKQARTILTFIKLCRVFISPTFLIFKSRSD